MRKKSFFLLAALSVVSLTVFAQKKQTEVSYYCNNRFSIGIFTKNKVYPELQIESNNLKVQDARYSILLRNKIPAEDFNFVWGLGFSYSDLDDYNCAVLPLEIRKTNLFSKNISLSVGLEFTSDFSEKVKVQPLVGVSFNL